jgi:predicted ATPase
VLSVTPSVESNIEVFSVTLAPSEAPAMRIPIAEHGAGMGQVLPILVLCTAATLDHPIYQTAPLLIFENPELHLHDAVHEELANLFLQTAGINGVRIIAETHSENVLLTTQIAELERSQEDKRTISINWVRKNDQGYSEIDQFRFDENGSLGGLWSRSIFGYTPELARRVMMLKMKKRATGGSNAN